MQTPDTSTTLRSIGWASLALVIIGALNWLLVGLFKFDLIAAVFGNLSAASRVLYTLVGLGGIYLAFAARSMIPHEPTYRHAIPLHGTR